LQVAGRDDFVPTWIERNFLRPMPREPSRIFVNSMSDLAYWEPAWTERVMARIAENPQHLFLFLSKQPWAFEWKPRENAMLGYSVTRQADYDQLQYGTCGVSFLSLEPLLERVDLWGDWSLHWVIVGAETGNRRDRIVLERPWLQEIFRFCRTRQVPLFFKASLRHLWPAKAEFPQEYPTGFPRSPQAAYAARR
jgi:protein gp37